MSTGAGRAASAMAPSPLEEGELEPFFAELARGASYRDALERLLLELPLERAQRFMLVLREGRAAWIPMLEQSSGRALFVGNACSGTLPALIAAGFEPTAIDSSFERLRFARERCLRSVDRSLDTALVRSGARLPFADQCFDLAVQEAGPDAPSVSLGELRRVARAALVLVADNRFAYKRSLGRHGEFRVPGPREYALRALRPEPGERSLRAHRRALREAGCARTRAFALYPHSQDYSHVVALDEPLPSLKIGPKERRNVWKLAARALGLFPLLAPSFALVGAVGERGASCPRIERVLDALSERLGAPPMVAEHVVATRGHCALVLTRARRRDDDPAARMCVHVPLAAHRRALAEQHVNALRHLRARHPTLPVPEPRFAGELEGAWIACEERLAGLGAPQISGRPALVSRTLADAARQLALLVASEAVVVDAAQFERLVSSKVELVARHCGAPETRAHLRRMESAARERLVGRSIRLALCHGDLRSKHVQVRPDGRVLGYLDWGTWQRDDLPYYDLLHLVANERRQERRLSAARGWALVREPRLLRASERGALDEYARLMGLDDELRAVIAELYPVLVAAMAERTWDYSRPRWLQRQFGIG